MKPQTALSILFLTLAIVACGGRAVEETAPPPEAEPTLPQTEAPTSEPTPIQEAEAASTWQAFTSEENSFSVLLPAEPTHQAQPVPNADGTVNEMDMFVVIEGNVGYTINVSSLADFPPERLALGADVLLSDGRDAALASMSGTLRSAEDITLDGFPGQHIEFEFSTTQLPNGEGVMRLYMTDANVYQLMAIGSQGQLPAEDVKRFLDSFQLLEQPAAAGGAISEEGAAMTALTAQEFYDLALAAALEWQPDAVLSRMDSGVMYPLDSEGRGEGWTAQFYSPMAKEMNVVSLVNGEIKAVASQYPAAPDLVPDMDSVNLGVRSLYDAVTAAAGSEYDENTEIIVTLMSDVLDESIPVWSFIYQKVGVPDPPFAVIIDARSGQVLRAAELSG